MAGLRLLQPSLPPEAADKPGYLIIGTYLLHKDALNKDNFAAAKKSMDSSGQGMYYKSEFADGTWFDLSGSTELSDISDAKGKKAVPVSRVEQLDLQIWIDEQGQLHNLMNPDVIAKQIEQLKQDIEKLQKDSRTAVEENKQSAVSRLALEQNQREASLAFLEALTAGKPEEAKSMLGRMGDPEARLPICRGRRPNSPERLVRSRRSSRHSSRKRRRRAIRSWHRSFRQSLKKRRWRPDRSDSRRMRPPRPLWWMSLKRSRRS
ncbi:hypothetical protein LJK88_26800 [Paenibacillus sp. P26]|nr:hypothetical protein LJK88_26800 [Paenibacillus sp. P26]